MSVASGGLSGELKKKDSATREKLNNIVEDIIEIDPEFVLKVKMIKSTAKLRSSSDCSLLSQGAQSETYLQSSLGSGYQASENFTLPQEILLNNSSATFRLDHDRQPLHDC